MDGNYDKCLEMILHHEGGYVNHPKDPGGMTNLGVTRRVYESWLGHAVDEHTMRGLTPEDVGPIYKKNYWDRIKGDDLQEGLNLCVLDFGGDKSASSGDFTIVFPTADASSAIIRIA